MVNVRALGQRGAQGSEKIVAAIVHAGAKAEFPGDDRALLVGARNAHGLGAPLNGQLADERTHGAQGRRDQYGLAGVHAGQFDDAGPGRQPGHAEHAEPGRKRRERTVDPLGPVAGRQGVFLPAAEVADVVAGGKRRMPGPDHLPHGFRHRHVARAQGLAARHVPARDGRALVGIQREVDVPDQHLAVPGFRERLVHHLEVPSLGDTSQ